jgi:DnaK suppressor protein
MTTKSSKGKSSGSAKSSRAAARKAPAKAPARAPAKPPARSQAGTAKAAKKAARPVPRPASKVPAPKTPVRPPAPPARPTKAKRRARSKEFEGYRALLLERLIELMQAYNLSKGDRRVHPDSGTEDYIDYAVSSYAKEFLLSLSEMDRKQILLVKDALARIARGEYGTCQQCGEEISSKRLEVAPWARYCLRCQDLDEQGLLPQYPGRIEADEADEEAEEPPAADIEEDLEPEEVGELEEEPLGEGGEEADEADE